MTIGEIVLMKPHESPRINKKSIRGDSRDSWPVWNRGIKWSLQVNDLLNNLSFLMAESGVQNQALIKNK